MSEPRYSAIHMTLLDAMIFATRVGATTGEMYLTHDDRDFLWMYALTKTRGSKFRMTPTEMTDVIEEMYV